MADITSMFYNELALSRYQPSKLFNICLEHITLNIGRFSVRRDDVIVRLNNEIIWPSEICDNFLDVFQKHSIVTDVIANLFRDTRRTHLTRINLNQSTITDVGLKCLLRHYPESIQLSNCKNLTPESLNNIVHYIKNVKLIGIGPSINILANNTQENDPTINLKAINLRKLSVKNIEPLSLRLHAFVFQQLTHLELTGTKLKLKRRPKFPHLISLTLYNVWWLDKNVNFIISLKKLQHLDISQCVDRYGEFTNPEETLTRIVESLPDLTSLDISGTNLAACPSSDDLSTACLIRGLSSRIKEPLKFLGLFCTTGVSSYQIGKPALRISGHRDEEQILTAMAVYMGRPVMLGKALDSLYHLFPCTPKSPLKALNLVLRAMDNHLKVKYIQIYGGAVLYFIVKELNNLSTSMRLRRHTITTIINAMDAFLNVPSMIRNGCLTIWHFNLPHDVIFAYERMLVILLKGVVSREQGGAVQRVAMRILNVFACNVGHKEKVIMGDYGIVSAMLYITADRLHEVICDDILEMAWNILWNVTDSTPSNSERFISVSGHEIFLECLKHFPGKSELLKNATGLMGTVVEVDKLRPAFMFDYILFEFIDLLRYECDGIEVSYNAAGLIAQLAADGEAAWTVEQPSRRDMLTKMIAAIDRWDLHSERSITYRTFKPLLKLLTKFHTPECQHWAAWALVNLTTVYPEKYCAMLIAENGIQLLKEIIHHSEPYKTIKSLASYTIYNCLTYSK